MTTSFADTVGEQLQQNQAFRRIYLMGALDDIFSGDLDIGRSMLRKYINATVGFIALGEALGRSSKTLMQMLGPKGNPNIRNFFEIVAYLQKVEGFKLAVVDSSASKKVSKGTSRPKAKVPARSHAKRAA